MPLNSRVEIKRGTITFTSHKSLTDQAINLLFAAVKICENLYRQNLFIYRDEGDRAKPKNLRCLLLTTRP